MTVLFYDKNDKLIAKKEGQTLEIESPGYIFLDGCLIAEIEFNQVFTVLGKMFKASETKFSKILIES